MVENHLVAWSKTSPKIHERSNRIECLVGSNVKSKCHCIRKKFIFVFPFICKYLFMSEQFKHSEKDSTHIHRIRT